MPEIEAANGALMQQLILGAAFLLIIASLAGLIGSIDRSSSALSFGASAKRNGLLRSAWVLILLGSAFFALSAYIDLYLATAVSLLHLFSYFFFLTAFVYWWGGIVRFIRYDRSNGKET